MLLAWGPNSADSSLHGPAQGDGGSAALTTAAYLERRSLRQEPDDAACEASSHVIDHGGVRCDVISLSEVHHKRHRPFFQRVLRLDGNDLVQPLLPLRRDPVGNDLTDIPGLLERLKRDFEDPRSSLNLTPAWNFSCRLRKRMMLRQSDKADDSVDLLITGCEVSLWAGEQFASDLHLSFPKLKIVSISANKLLGMLGQTFPIPQEGFQLNASSYSFRNSVVLLISQSGGTFSTLAVTHLLRAVTKELFSVTSEWDTQVARSVREAPKDGAKGVDFFASHTFSTFAGFRPAEPCSISLVATHTLLTHLLIFTMNHLAETRLAGSTFEVEEVRELAAFHDSHIEAVKAIVGVDDSGKPKRTNASEMLRAQGHRWSQHILEGPISWILSAVYIAATVIAGATPLSTLVAALVDGSNSASPTTCVALNASLTSAPEVDIATTIRRYAVGVADAFVYIFLPIWTTWLLRLLQCRPLLHRVAGRSILIGDIPWVAQACEAYVSKLFALSYSIASVSVASANPLDHLVHRHTHRVVRGSLLAVGRPDARLNALTTADSATCLAINQACAIVNWGHSCEAITIGHHADKPPMVEGTIVRRTHPDVLPALRPPVQLVQHASPLTNRKKQSPS